MSHLSWHRRQLVDKEDYVSTLTVEIEKPHKKHDSNQIILLETAGDKVSPLAEDFFSWGIWVLEEVYKDVRRFYEDSHNSTVIAYLWARTIRCPNPQCGAAMPMVRQWWLSNKPKRRIALRPVIDQRNRQYHFEVVSGDAIDFDPSQGTTGRLSARCLVCEQTVEATYLQQEGQEGRIEEILLAVVYVDQASTSKQYRVAAQSDYEILGELETELAQLLEGNDQSLLSIPNESLPYLRSIFNVHVYGITEWGQLFNARQVFVALKFIEKIQEAYKQITQVASEEYAQAIVTYLALSLDRLIEYNTTSCVWQTGSEAITPTFGRQALPMIWDYVEVNPFSGSIGDWEKNLQRTADVIQHCARTASKAADIYHGTATRLPHNHSSLSAVITDPPYYDAVPYADLSDFFYVWLRRSVGNCYPDVFETPLTPKSTEIVQLAERNTLYQHKDKEFYEEQLTEAFREANRVLVDSGIFVVVFAHKSTTAWETLLNSLLQAGLVVTASWPLHTETSSRLRSHGSGSLASSIFIVCRKRVADHEGVFDDVSTALRVRIRDRLDFFWSQGIRGADFFISAIGPAVEVFGRYKTVRKLSGEVVSVSDLLTLIQEAVADYALGQIMNGRYRMGAVDAPTRFYVMYRWSYGKDKLTFDDARRLAQALGAEVGELIHRLGLLKQSGEDVNLLGPLQREKVERLGERGREGADVPLIDLVHRAVLLWREGDRMALANYLTTHAMGREDALRAVAQALVNVLPDGDRERQLLEGFLVGQDNLPPADMGREVRLPGME